MLSEQFKAFTIGSEKVEESYKKESLSQWPTGKVVYPGVVMTIHLYPLFPSIRRIT